MLVRDVGAHSAFSPVGGSAQHELDGLASDRTADRRSWQAAYIRRIVLGDLVCAALGAATGCAVGFGPGWLRLPHHWPSPWLLVTLPLVWVVAMFAARSYEERYLWLGVQEFRRVYSAALLLLATVGTVSWGFRLEVARGFVVLALPLATALTLLHRAGQRAWLHRQRRRGQHHRTMLIAGHAGAVAALHEQIRRESHHGYQVVGCCLPADRQTGRQGPSGLPVLGTLHAIAEAVVAYDVDTVAVLPCPEFDGAGLRQLGWQLESTRAELLVAPALTEVVASRVGIRPIGGLPLLHLERPELRGPRRVLKDVVDRAAAAVALIVVLPVMIAVALAVRFSSAGPVIFRQERVGLGGRPFAMLKFRTMVDGADQMIETLTAANDGNGVLFKLRSDPRVTRVGRLLRRYSLDELPQLLNVLRGDMSLVGPRPPLPGEVEKYGPAMRRRFLVKPGITGLWQVSGRSDLSWDDSERIDVRYVENWSLTVDLMIVLRTLKAVLRGPGAY